MANLSSYLPHPKSRGKITVLLAHFEGLNDVTEKAEKTDLD